jgi:hypothetical protein
MECRTMIRLALSGLATVAAFAPLAAPAHGQDAAPGNSQSEPRANPRADARSLRERWDALSPEDQRHVLESYERWKQLSPDDRALMKRRFDRLDGERTRTRDLLDDDDRRSLEQLRDPERHRELTRRAKAAVRERFEQLPPDLRDRIERELRPLPLAEREQRVKQSVKQHLEREIRERLARKVASGELSRDAVEELRRQALEKEGDPRARLELLRNFLVEHPDAFHLTPEQVDRVKDARDAGAGLRLLDRLRRRPIGDRPQPGDRPQQDDRPPLPPRPPRHRGV